MISNDISKKIYDRFEKLYKSFSKELLDELITEIGRIKLKRLDTKEKWDEKDCFLITYGDSIRLQGRKPLEVLNIFLEEFICGTINRIHILPFFPYTSDDGFSVSDYRKVNPEIGSWDDMEKIGKNYILMFDLVINHVSKQSEWFQNFQRGAEPGADFFITVSPGTDLSEVIRPRSLPLLTEFETSGGKINIWTTFSSDQIDLNFANPEVLIQILKVFLFYIEKGARAIRLDAIAYLWKQPGTSCIHLPQTHEIVKLMRDIKDYLDPDIILITETNVPNNENLSYFGIGDEADMIYQFSLPPLLLHALYSGSSYYINEWISSLSDIPNGCTFFNFTASHDGIGVRPLEGLLPSEEVLQLSQAIKNAGGYISTRHQSDGTDKTYELNITYFDALKYTKAGTDDFQVDRFICSQTIMMSLQGIPAFYIHSLLGTQNAYDEVEKTGMPRSINRKKWNSEELFPLLRGKSIHSNVFNQILRRISIRSGEKCFHPGIPQQIMNIGDQVFALSRGTDSELIVIANLQPVSIMLDLSKSGITFNRMKDLLSDSSIQVENLRLKPYQVVWLKNKG